MNRIAPVLAAAFALIAPLAGKAQTASNAPGSATPPDWRETYAYMVGMQAVVYGYPIIKNTMQRYGLVERPAGEASAPVNAWYHARRPSSADDKYGSSVTPDLLYSAAWYDVSREPLVVTVPDAGKYYYSIQMMEMYSDVFGYVGLRATGNRAGSYLIVGPDWKGATPKGIAGVHRSPTPTGLLLLRIVYDSRDNLEPTFALQDQTRLAPLSYWQAGKQFVAAERDVLDPVPPKSEPLGFFRTLNRGMTENPPPAKDAPLIAVFASVGLGPGMSDDFSTLHPATRRGLERAASDGLALLVQVAKTGGNAKIVNNWAYGQKSWGRTAESNDFLTRAANQSLSGMQEHWIEEVVKLRAHHDSQGQLLNGTSSRYVLHFAPGQIPEAQSFWSVTLYDDHYDLAANAINRYSRGSQDKDMVYGKDGSLEIHVQAEPPAPEKRANWLPAPRGPFNLFLRAYLPGKSLLDQTYVPPAVERVE